MDKKECIRNWPETKELVNEARIEASIQTGLAIRKGCEFKIINLLHLLYDKCRVRSDMQGILQIDERDIIMDKHLGHYWQQMKREKQALKQGKEKL